MCFEFLILWQQCEKQFQSNLLFRQQNIFNVSQRKQRQFFRKPSSDPLQKDNLWDKCDPLMKCLRRFPARVEEKGEAAASKMFHVLVGLSHCVPAHNCRTVISFYLSDGEFIF